MKTIWSSRGYLDKFLDMSVEEKRRELTNWYDQEMVDQLSDDQLDDYIADNQVIYIEAAEDFEYRVAPMIANQVNAGLILDEKFNLVDPAALLDFDGNSAELDEYDDGLYFDVEGRKKFPILGFSDDPDEFIAQLDELDILSTIHNLYPNWEDEDIQVYDIADLIPMDWDLLDKVLTHAHNELGVADEFLTEAKAKNPNKLAAEYEEIKDLAEEYGREYLTQMPFTSYDNDPISIEFQYPEFFRVVKSFFKEMDILTPEELNNPDELDFQWDQGIDQHDWDVLMKACEKLSQNKGVQFEKEYKTGYNSVLDDNEILAKREKEESLKEDFYRGVEGVNFIDNGQWADPQLEYNGETFNYWSVENDLWHDFLAETGHTDAEADDPEVEEQFNEYVQNNCISYLDSMLADSDDTITEAADENDWPWGNPNSNLPRKQLPTEDSSAIDSLL